MLPFPVDEDHEGTTPSEAWASLMGKHLHQGAVGTIKASLEEEPSSLPGVLGTSLVLSYLNDIYSLQSQKKWDITVKRYHPTPAISQLPLPTLADSFQAFVSFHVSSTPCHQKATLLIIPLLTVTVFLPC